MAKRLGFRGWFYFRQGWSTYFAFIFAAVNTLTVTYFLAIENYPFLKDIFPNFLQYVLIVSAVGIPVLISVGYAHYKRTPSYRAEADVWFESNPYWGRVVVNSEILLQLNLKLTNLLISLSKNKSLTDSELSEIENLKNELDSFVNSRHMENRNDYSFFKKIDKPKSD